MVGALGILGTGAVISIVIQAVDKFTNVFKNVNAKLLATGVAITAVGLAGAKLVGGLIKIAGEFEQTQIAFTTMLGSAEKADKLLRELADFATKTPFTITGVEQNAKQLLAMSIETDKLLPTLKALGDVSAGLNVPLSRLVLNFGQVKTAGKLMGRELRDFRVAGVNLAKELAKNLNKTEKEIVEMVSRSEIGFADVEAAFISMTSEGGIFFDLMDKQSQTFLGQVSNIQDSFERLGRVMGEVFLPAAKWVAEHLAVIIGWLEQHPTIAKFVAVTLGLVTALALLAGIIMIVTAVSGALAILWSPITLIVLAIAVAIGLLVALGVALWKNWDKLGTKTKILLGILFPFVVLPIAIMKNWEPIKEFFAKLWNSIVGYFEVGVNGVIWLINKLIWAYNKIAGFFGREKIGTIGKVSFGGAMIDIEALRKPLEIQEKITEELEEQSKYSKIIDINQKSFAAESFRSLQDFENFMKAQKIIALHGAESKQLEFIPEIRDVEGRIINIRIENVNGTDPEDLSRALSDELSTKMSL